MSMRYNPFMEKCDLMSRWQKEEKEVFTGWDFSHLDGRYERTELPWDYRSEVKKYLKREMKLLDMGTGGGEFLLTLDHPYENTTVTEGYSPNVDLIKNKLVPLGIRLCVVTDDKSLDLPSDSFDMVINRHEAYDLNEVVRILKNGGMFITQQVAGDNDMMLSQRLIPGFRSAFPTHDLLHQKKAFEDHGLIVIYSDEALIPSCFYDVGAVVYYAKAIPWEFPGFSVEKCYSGLLDLHSDILKYGYISSNESRFIIETVNYKEDRI